MGNIWNWLKKYSWQVAVPILYFALMVLYYPFRSAFWMDFDEGINLVKAQLVLRGYTLYTDIWSDQPPLFTFLLATVFRYFGQRANLGRILVLVLSCGLMWAYLQYLSNVWGKWHAVSGVFLLLLLPGFLNLSTSVMVGLPAIAFAMFSMWALVFWHRQHKYIWLIVSALMLALSILTKIFTGFLPPIFLAGILFGEFDRYRETGNWQRAVTPALLWGCAFALFFALPAIIIIAPGNFGQLLQSHIEASQLEVFQNNPSYSLAWQLRDARLILYLAILGAVYSLFTERWLALYALAWTASAYALLFRYVPVWSHQQLATLAAGATGEAFSGFFQGLRTIALNTASKYNRNPRLSLTPISRRIWVDLASISLFALILLARGPVTLSAFNPSPTFRGSGFRATSSEAKLLRKLQKYASQTHWLVTDLPIFAFYTDLPVPPNLAVFSSKRVSTGELSEEKVLATIQEYQPEQVLFGRFEFPSIRQYLRSHYHLVHSRGLYELYISEKIISAETTE